MLYVSETDAD